MNYQGTVALVTGGTGDIGQAVVARLAQEGLQVAFTFARNAEAAQALVAGHAGKQVTAHQISALDLAGVRQLISEIKTQHGGLHYLVNSIGRILDRSFLRMEPEDWRAAITDNLDSTYVFCRAAWFDLIKQPGNAIVNLSSVSGLAGAVGQANYAAAKAGVVGLTRSLAREAGPLGLRVNAVAPGYIESRMTAQLPEALRLKALGLIPLRRFGLPEEVAATVAFLLSEEARYINGQTLVVDGGLL